MKHGAQIITLLSAKKGPMVQCHQRPLKLDLDPIFLSRELLSQGTKSATLNTDATILMAGTAYFGQIAVQPRDHIPVNTELKSHNHTLSRH